MLELGSVGNITSGDWTGHLMPSGVGPRAVLLNALGVSLRCVARPTDGTFWPTFCTRGMPLHLEVCARQPQPVAFEALRPARLPAEVVTSDSAAAGGTVLFRLVEPPLITDEGRFRLRLQTDALAYARQAALCTIELEGGERVSFTGIVTCLADAEVCDVEMDEAAVAAVAGSIPLERVSLFLPRP